MQTKKTITDQLVLQDEANTNHLSRRKFLGYVGVSSALAATVVSCSKGDHIPPGFFGSGDIGILNYAYLLEQLEAAFYLRVIAQPYGKMNDYEKGYLTDVRDHEVSHREFLKAALGDKAIPKLEFNFSSINFENRSSVLTSAKTFEDLGVSAYNGAGQYISSPDYLTIAGKIVSVEARHAALIRELIELDSFADSSVIDSNGLDQANDARKVLLAALPFLITKIDISHLPF